MKAILSPKKKSSFASPWKRNSENRASAYQCLVMNELPCGFQRHRQFRPARDLLQIRNNQNSRPLEIRAVFTIEMHFWGRIPTSILRTLQRWREVLNSWWLLGQIFRFKVCQLGHGISWVYFTESVWEPEGSRKTATRYFGAQNSLCAPWVIAG